MAHTYVIFPLLWAAVYTLGEYKFFHQGDFWNSIKNLSKTQFFPFFEICNFEIWNISSNVTRQTTHPVSMKGSQSRLSVLPILWSISYSIVKSWALLTTLDLIRNVRYCVHSWRGLRNCDFKHLLWDVLWWTVESKVTGERKEEDLNNVKWN